VIVSQVLASAVSLIDIAMLGRLGPSALAAVGYVTQFFWLAQAVLMAIGVAGVALIAPETPRARARRSEAACSSRSASRRRSRRWCSRSRASGSAC